MTPDERSRELLAQDIETERRLLWSEIGILCFVVFLVCCYLIVIS